MDIRISCDVRDRAPLDKLHIIQGQLKTLSDENYSKLKNQIINEGFSFPFFVWELGGIYNILDGTHRKLTLLKLREEGFKVPDLPIVKIQARDLSHAKKKLLAVTSSYAKIDKHGLYEYMSDVDWKVEDICSFDLEGVDNGAFIKEFFEDNNEELKPDGFDDDAEIGEDKFSDLIKKEWTRVKNEFTSKGIDEIAAIKKAEQMIVAAARGVSA